MSNGYKAALKRFEDAVVSAANAGGTHPMERHGIQQEYEEAKNALILKLTFRAGRAVEQSDHDIAIGEDAFMAGWNASGEFWSTTPAQQFSRDKADAARAACWSAYTPPEELCGGGHSGG